MNLYTIKLLNKLSQPKDDDFDWSDFTRDMHDD